MAQEPRKTPPRPAKPRVIVTRRLPPDVEARMAELFDASFNVADAPMDRAAMARAMAECDVLVPTITDQIDAALIESAPDRLRLIASFGSGVDHIDLIAARQKGIIVTNTPGVLTEDTADMTMALILAVPRRLYEGAQLIRSGEWKGWAPTLLPSSRIWGKRLGIIGMGRIGTALARRARGFGLNIHYHNRRPAHPDVAEELDATYWESLDQMLARVDIVSVNCPRTPATYHLLSRRRLALLQPHAFIVNTSRGEVVDERALGDMIEAGQLAGAGLDVFEHEPAVDQRLMAADSVVLLPHLGSATFEGRQEMGEKVVINIRTFVDGHTPPDRVLETMF